MAVTQGSIKRYIQGQITLNGTNEVTITVPGLRADSVIIPSLNTVGGTPEAIYVSSKNTTTGVIGFKSQSGDTSTYDIVVLV